MMHRKYLKNRKKQICFFIAFCLVVLCSGCGRQTMNSQNTETNSISTEVSGNMESSSETVSIEEAEVTEEPESTQVSLGTFTMYFSGIDVWGWTDTKSRSDVNLLAVVNTDTRHILLINTPRDYFVEMPISNGAKDKLTHAGLYGVDNSIGTLENLYDIKIDYYLRMNFSGFESIIDTVGGVDVYSEYDFTVEPIKHYREGYNHRTGLEALAFVRERHAFASGDNQRGWNQMALLQAMIKKVCSLDFLMNYEEVMDQLTDMYRTNMPPELVADLIFNQLADDTDWTVDTFSVTGSSGKERTYSTPNTASYVMVPNWDDIEQAKKLIAAVQSENVN